MPRIKAAFLAVVCLTALAACQAERLFAPNEVGAVGCTQGTSFVRVEVGQAVIPAPGVKRCRFAAEAGAEYALAWLDTRAITASKFGVEPWFDPYPIRMNLPGTVASLEGAAHGVREQVVPSVLDQSHGENMSVGPSAEDILQAKPRHRLTPWTLDEVFLLDDGWGAAARLARVVRVYNDTIVVVRWDDDPTDFLDQYLAQLDTAMATYSTHALPVLRGAFATGMPRSSTAGQTLIILQTDLQSRGRAVAEVSGDSLFTWLELLPFPYSNALPLAQFLAHETTHIYQRMYLHSTRPLPGLVSTWGAASWADEGAANLVSYEMLRRVVGVPLDANYNWRGAAPSLAAAYYAQRAQPGGGVITDGFDNAMGFFRDLVLRRMASGEPMDIAFGAVVRGASEGWYGHDGIIQRTGLVTRMQQRLGAKWSPTNALLDWALSHAGDDLTANPIYQDRASLLVSDIPVSLSYGWRPDANLSAAAPWVLFFKSYGSPGYAIIRDSGTGVDITVEGFMVPIEWKVLRIR